MTLNTVVFDGEMEEVKKICQAAKTAGVDAVIAADMAVIMAARAQGLTVHLSVQANIANLEAVKFYAAFADVMVLARELTLDKIARICRGIEEERITGPSGELVKIEVFIHGALCVAVSGKCYMSLAVFNSSANRGDCYQVCRRAYTVKDSVLGNELEIENNYVMSPRDICTVGAIGKILDAGVKVLKIEGRGRSADYVAKATAVYREAVDMHEKGVTPSKEEKEKWLKELESVFNRGFWQGGYYLGEESSMWAQGADNKADKVKVLCGKVTNYYRKGGIVELLLNAGEVNKGDEFLITGPTTGAVEGHLEAFRSNGEEKEKALKGEVITFPYKECVRKNDSFFILQKREN
jgi:putative protease